MTASPTKRTSTSTDDATTRTTHDAPSVTPVPCPNRLTLLRAPNSYTPREIGFIYYSCCLSNLFHTDNSISK